MIELKTTLWKYTYSYRQERDKVLEIHYINGSLKAFGDFRIRVFVSSKRCNVH